MTTPAPDHEMTARIDSDVRRPPRGRGSEAQFAPGTIIAGRYRISSILGSGGMGEVYRADDIKLGQAVALKFLPARLARDPILLERLHDEVRLGRQIAHPNVCRIYDIIDWEEAHFVSMEYVDGEDLSRLLHRIGRLAHDKAVDIARGITAGLHAAHGKGILHRDLKPANIMIDSHGEARIMDFGLALAAEDESQEGVIAGTPAYMAPEQVAGHPATIQSDLYALGLVMYELFTGKRAHSGKTLRERERDASSEITTPSSVIRDMDPAVERIILRCLEQEPGRRPRSAREVIDSLPGGDPLTAALAAGETPSPRIVAAAGTEGTLKPATAVALLGSVVALIVATFAIARADHVLGTVHFDKPPEVQLERATTLLRQFGIPAQDFTSLGISEKDNYLGWIYTHDHSPRRWERLGRGLPMFSFWVREQAQPLIVVPLSRHRRITIDDPPQYLPGASTIELDPRGRLVSLSSIVSPSWTARPLDWRPLFAAAGFELAAFAPAAPEQLPSSIADARAAWTGRHPEDGTPIRVEAAAWHGTPVLFRIIAPWDALDESARVPFGSGGFSVFILTLVSIAFIGGIFVAWRNLRLRRGDREGALRFGSVLLLCTLIGNLLVTEHHMVVTHEVSAIGFAMMDALFWSTMITLVYVAVEPSMRRRWPNRLISWARLVGGRWRDPMVGRDILIGLAGGCLHSAVAAASTRFNGWITGAPGIPYSGDLTTLDSVSTIVAQGALAVTGGVMQGLTLMFGLILLTFVFRNRGIAVGALAACFMFGFTFASREPGMLITFAIIATLLVFVLARFGLLAMSAFQFAFLAVFFNPPPAALGWYTGRALILPLFVLAIALWAFRTSLGDQKLITADF